MLPARSLWTLVALSLSHLIATVYCLPVYSDIIQDDVKNFFHLSNPGSADMWTDRLVPVVIELRSSEATTLVKTAMWLIEKETCVKFRDITAQTDSMPVDYVRIIDGSSCMSSVGRRGGPQILELGSGCRSIGIALHELLHTLGFWHEHNRSDRDRYVTINWGNILSGNLEEFKIRSDDSELVKNVEYDYHSIMHYRVNEFSRYDDFNNPAFDTIVVRGIPEAAEVTRTTLGQRVELSYLDIKKIRWLYSCEIAYCMWPNLPNGRLYPARSKYEPGDVITLYCNSGFYPIIDNSIKCKSNGKWAGTVPFCMDLPNDYNYNTYLYEDFENDTTHAKWTLQTPKWKLGRGQSPCLDIGPHFDHTNENSTGNYLYVDTSKLEEKQVAEVKADGRSCRGSNCCLMFYYNMFGAHHDTLNVYVALFVGKLVKQVWSSPSEHSRDWTAVIIKDINQHMGQISSTYQVIFRVYRQTGTSAIVAIDDVFMGLCSEIMDYYKSVMAFNQTATKDSLDSDSQGFGLL